MPNKTLRILIADEQHFHRMKIERMLNQLGYYRIAPMHRLVEVLNVVEYGSEPMDLVIIDASLGLQARLDIMAFCMDNPQIRHVLVYGSDLLTVPSMPLGPQRKMYISSLALPDYETISCLMRAIDTGGRGKAPAAGMLLSSSNEEEILPNGMLLSAALR
ncbi:response regulator [Pseudomonas sp. NFIX28]|uniref:response regulator n=1 Tax=Pseudomonas sp. NFIX28 TaxID=1566235 RepID=UPI000B837B81|nr:response regulator [Pseudomonas sp. NFIX28]